ncbi:MAG: hypothetical protein SFU99_17080 [Saprospiraceae bacterium]|nr:hypothetical protein [Saprospiraceae bacterium]
MEAVIKIKPSELTNELVDNIKRMFGENKNVEITISVQDSHPKAYLYEQTQEEYAQRLNTAIDNIKNNENQVLFTMEEFEEFAESLSRP